MNAAQHANNILDAWHFGDLSHFGTALGQVGFAGASSRFEMERREVLESVVDHLRRLSAGARVPNVSESRGSAALLQHLGSDAHRTQTPDHIGFSVVLRRA